jgi:2-dehydropantoate 2-reductase
MRVGIVGTGGVGGYYGAKLAASGTEVCFIARGNQYRILAEQGLRVESESGSVHLKELEVYDDAAKAPQVDVALSCVKLYDAEEAARLCGTLLGKDGYAISLQNGIDGPKFLSDSLGSERAIAGSVVISAFVEKPGLIRHVGSNQSLRVEKRAGRTDEFFDVCQRAGFQSQQVKDPELLLWKKFIRLVPLSGIAVLCRSALGILAGNDHLRFLLRNLIAETVAVGKASGVDLEDSMINEILCGVESLPREFKPSLLLDLERGKALEAPWLAGRVVQLGTELQVPTPYNDCIWAALLPFVQSTSSRKEES